MQRALIAVMVMLLSISWPANAQPAERTLIDATLYVNPPDSEGLCMGMGAGQLTVTVRRAAEARERRPAVFHLYGFMDDPDTQIEIPISRQEATVTTHISGSDHYCWGVMIGAPEAANLDMAQRGAYVQTIDVRIVHRPD